MYVCSCFGITEQEVKQHADSGRCTPRQIASACKAGTDCGSCVKRIQSLLGRGAGCTTRDRLRPAAQQPERVVAEPAASPPAPQARPEPVAPEPVVPAAGRPALPVPLAVPVAVPAGMPALMPVPVPVALSAGLPVRRTDAA